MSMRTALLVSALAASTMALAGCADGSGPGAPGGALSPEDLAAGTGAIAGLLVDDRFRPIHLTDEAATEFQATGFVLLQETGDQVQTTANGEFRFLDLAPGEYTLRVQADGHEATPQRVGVQEGVFNEVSVVARRVVSAGGTLVTEEFSAFVPCTLHGVWYSVNPDCSFDQSGDSYRFDIQRDYSTFSDLTWMVTEILLNQEPEAGSAFDGVIRRTLGHDFSSAVIFAGRYMKMHMVVGGVSPDPVPVGTEFHEWPNEEEIQVALFGRGYFSEEIREAYSPVYEATGQPASMRRGVGAQVAVQAKFLVSLFLGEPEVDPLEYCALCGPD